MAPRPSLRELIQRPMPVTAPLVLNPLMARMAEAAGFPAGAANGHHLVNRSTQRATYLEIGTRSNDEDATYSDVDLRAEKRDGRYRFVRKSGEPYE